MQIIPADTKELIEASYRIRHQVYCEELNFEPIRESRLETDEFDNNAVHLLLLDSNVPVGCVRIVFGNLPCLRFKDALYNHIGINWSQTCEVSRLAILPEYRNLENSKALYLKCFEYGRERNKAIAVVAKKSLMRRLNSCGLSYVQVSDYFELNGQRAIFWTV